MGKTAVDSQKPRSLMPGRGGANFRVMFRAEEIDHPGGCRGARAMHSGDEDAGPRLLAPVGSRARRLARHGRAQPAPGPGPQDAAIASWRGRSSRKAPGAYRSEVLEFREASMAATSLDDDPPGHFGIFTNDIRSMPGRPSRRPGGAKASPPISLVSGRRPRLQRLQHRYLPGDFDGAVRRPRQN